MDKALWRLEGEWLERVRKEIQNQLDQSVSFEAHVKREYMDTQREMWREIGAVSASDGLDKLVDFMQAIQMTQMHKRGHAFAVEQAAKYEKMLDSPYFGRIDFKDDGSDQVEHCYIGMQSLMDDACHILVYDWRAPISSMFYDNEVGEASYICPDGPVKGVLALKRQYKIESGVLIYMFDSNVAIEDEMLKDLLGKSTDQHMNAIVTSIQREQNAVIRNDTFRHLIVQGAAGSGKTSVALHRIAYLLYKYRSKLKAEHIMIFSPNALFNTYISNVLPQLGEENMLQTTFQDFMHAGLGANHHLESYGELLELTFAKQNAKNSHRRVQSMQLKSSRTYADGLKSFVDAILAHGKSFKPVLLEGQCLIDLETIQALFYVTFADYPLKQRLEKLNQRLRFLVDPIMENWRTAYNQSQKHNQKGKHKGSQRELARQSFKATQRTFERVFETIEDMTRLDPFELYRQFVSEWDKYLEVQSLALNLGELQSDTLEGLDHKWLNYEDQIAITYLEVLTGHLSPLSEIKYVVVDEAQDYTPMQYEILYSLFDRANFTILGDLNQAIHPYLNVGGYERIEPIFGQSTTRCIELNKRYRSTIEITDFARSILNRAGSDVTVGRHGEPPLFKRVDTVAAMDLCVMDDVQKSLEKGHRAVGLLTKTAHAAQVLYERLKDKINLHMMCAETDVYATGIVVMPAYLAKGLEFDTVVMVDMGMPETLEEDERLLYYTACTRALHVLNGVVLKAD